MSTVDISAVLLDVAGFLCLEFTLLSRFTLLPFTPVEALPGFTLLPRFTLLPFDTLSAGHDVSCVCIEESWEDDEAFTTGAA
jgi:hypothetical protein